MIPIRDSAPARRPAWVMWALLAANVWAFAQEIRAGAAADLLVARWGVTPAHWQLASAADFAGWPGLFLTLITAQFLHGSLMHLAFNMLYLWIFGNNVEDRLGHGWFLALYVVSGIFAAVAQIFVTPLSAVPMVGASGAIAGVLGAYLLLFPSARVLTLVPLGLWWETIEMPAYLFLGIWFLLQWVQGLAGIGQIADVGGIAFWAHIGGFVAGMVGAVVAHPRRARR